MIENLFDKYPHLKNRANAKLSRIKVAPINRKSNNKDKKISISKKVANDIISKSLLKDMPVHYTKISEAIPEKHKNDDGKFIEIGHILNEGEIILDGDTEFIEVDIMLYSESQKDLVEEVLDNHELIGSSWEIVPNEGIKTNTHVEITSVNDVIGNALMSANKTAFEGTKIVYCSTEELLEDFYADDDFTTLKRKLNFWGKDNHEELTPDEIKLLKGIFREVKKISNDQIKLMKAFIDSFINEEKVDADLDITYDLIEKFNSIIDTIREKNDPDYYKKLSSQLSEDNKWMADKIKTLSARAYDLI